MAIKVLALASGVTGLADHRVLNGAMMQPAGQISVRSGVLPGATSGNLSTVSAMVARVAPVKVLINNSISSALGPYLLVSDANVDITFDAGEAAVPRVDRIIARAYDNTNDASGSTLGNIYYLKGTSGGSATALPNNSVLLYEMTIPAGASAGGGGVNFANAVDQRVYTTAQGGIVPVKSNTDMAAISNPHEGYAVYRTDLDVLYIYDGTTWRSRGVANVASSANLTDINNPYDGAVAITRDTDAVYVYNGSSWAQPKHFFKPVGRIVATGAQSLADNTATAITFTDTDEIDTHAQHNPGVNPTRITPNVAGYYRFYGTVTFGSRADYVDVNAWFRKNGATNMAGGQRNGFSGVTTSVQTCVAQATVLMNGSTDYVELIGQQNNGANVSQTLNQSSQFSSALEWEYLGPSSY